MNTQKPDPLEQRKKLSFEQAEGIAPMPSQLARGDISQEFPAVSRAELDARLDYCKHNVRGTSFSEGPWETILKNAHVFRDYKPIDDFSNRYHDLIGEVRKSSSARSVVAGFGVAPNCLKHSSYDRMISPPRLTES